MKRSAHRKAIVLLFVSVLVLTPFMKTANAALTFEGVRTWFWTDDTYISSVAVGDVDGDGEQEIVTGGIFTDGTRRVAQLCVWNWMHATLVLQNVRTWFWTDDTYISSVAVGDVDGDGKQEIVTGGSYEDGTRRVAQLCVWDGATLALENVRTWYWTDDTYISSVAVGDVDGDGKQEIVTGGSYEDGTRRVAQLCVWDGATLALENVQTWYWIDSTLINSVAVGDVDGDGSMEIVTGGSYFDGSSSFVQLCVWNRMRATLTLENVQIKSYSGAKHFVSVSSVAVGDVDGDGSMEIVVGTQFGDPSYYLAGPGLCIYDGATLTLENTEFWRSGAHNSYLGSVTVGDVDGDSQVEIVTGSYYHGFVPATYRYEAELLVWDGATLTVENSVAWCWTDDTYISSVAVGDVDGDGKQEIVTGGAYEDGTRRVAQLCVWS